MPVKQSIDFGFDDHPDDEDKSRVAWVVTLIDDCEGCDDLRVEVSLEAEGERGAGLTAHLSPATARRVRAALASALREVGEDPGT